MATGDDDNDLELHYPQAEQWLEEFSENREFIVEFLNELQTLSMHNPSEARQRFRNFAHTSNFSDSFNAVFLGLMEYEEFLEDVRTIEGEELAESFIELGDRFSGLKRDLYAVYLEKQLLWENPIDYTEGELTGFEPNRNSPLFTERLYSGNRQVASVTASPVHILEVAGAIITDLREAFEHADDDMNLDEISMSSFAQSYHQIYDELDAFSDLASEKDWELGLQSEEGSRDK